MNERLKELVEQAKQYAYAKADNGFDFYYGEDFEEKFAELLIQDCIDCVDGYTKPRTFGTHYDAVEQIKANFGIEQ